MKTIKKIALFLMISFCVSQAGHAGFIQTIREKFGKKPEDDSKRRPTRDAVWAKFLKRLEKKYGSLDGHEQKVLRFLKNFEKRKPDEFAIELVATALKDGSTLLHVAAKNGFEDLGADVLRQAEELKFVNKINNAPDNEGKTPMFYALELESFDMLDLFFEHGVFLNLFDDDGEALWLKVVEFIVRMHELD